MLIVHVRNAFIVWHMSSASARQRERGAQQRR